MNVLVTGGLGVVGSAYVKHCLDRGDRVVVLDNYARLAASEANARWLLAHPRADKSLRIDHGDVINTWDIGDALEALGRVDVVIHLAAQSSVNMSMTNPLLDFQSNAMGTFHLFEMLRHRAPEARIVYFTSNKIYETSQWETQIVGLQYQWKDRDVGPSEEFPFYTDAREPYGASKIAGLYYARCYAALYGLPIVVAVPSGMYGERQYGKAEQGWLGWFCIATEFGWPIQIHGDGMQVRDMCHVDDVNTAIDFLLELAPEHKGELFNIGGGPNNAVSLIEVIGMIAESTGKMSPLEYHDWRPQDNKRYVSNIGKMERLGWTPKVSLREGVDRICRWVKDSRDQLEQIYASRP